ncbi:hypothetical protein F4809DRAFT_42860 [Biscogniauxia mediterranea]|nr:hypothetical protein F4809DRAFT_42860 [Biscogniauxia mediterranea]
MCVPVCTIPRCLLLLPLGTTYIEKLKLAGHDRDMDHMRGGSKPVKICLVEVDSTWADYLPTYLFPTHLGIGTCKPTSIQRNLALMLLLSSSSSSSSSSRRSYEHYLQPTSRLMLFSLLVVLSTPLSISISHPLPTAGVLPFVPLPRDFATNPCILLRIIRRSVPPCRPGPRTIQPTYWISLKHFDDPPWQDSCQLLPSRRHHRPVTVQLWPSFPLPRSAEETSRCRMELLPWRWF